MAGVIPVMLAVDSGNYGQRDAGRTGFSQPGGDCRYSAVLAVQASAPMSMFSNQVRYMVQQLSNANVPPEKIYELKLIEQSEFASRQLDHQPGCVAAKLLGVLRSALVRQPANSNIISHRHFLSPFWCIQKGGYKYLEDLSVISIHPGYHREPYKHFALPGLNKET